jgi:hypothetical protein
VLNPSNLPPAHRDNVDRPADLIIAPLVIEPLQRRAHSGTGGQAAEASEER